MDNRPSSRYPARCRRTHRIADLQPGEPATLAGRLIALDVEGTGRVRDDSGVAEVLLGQRSEVQVGAIVEVVGVWEPPVFHAREVRLLAPACSADGAKGQTFSELTPRALANLKLRAQVISGVRSFFDDAGFLEVETNLIVRCPGMEPHLSAFETGFRQTGKDRRLYLHTSPEYAMKRLLSAGLEKIYQVGKAFRHEPASSMHNPEFTLLEWYRAYSDYREIMEDAEDLVHGLCLVLKGGPTIRFGKQTVDLTPPWERLTVAEAFSRHTGIQFDPAADPEGFFEAARRHASVVPEDDWETAFFKVFLDSVERKLGADRPTILTGYPASMASLAKRASEAPHLPERFEIYIAGVELANAFTELNDPVEQRARLLNEAEMRRRNGDPVYPQDGAFLSALEHGMPPSAGIAMGVDRLVMLFADAASVGEVIAVPFPDL